MSIFEADNEEQNMSDMFVKKLHLKVQRFPGRASIVISLSLEPPLKSNNLLIFTFIIFIIEVILFSKFR